MIQRPRYAPVHSAAKAENVPAGRSLPIEAVEGVGPTYGGRLREANVGTTNDFIVLGPKRVAHALQGTVARNALDKWHAMFLLMLIEGLGPQEAEALEASGHGS